jgi:hypothetical protein
MPGKFNHKITYPARQDFGVDHQRPGPEPTIVARAEIVGWQRFVSIGELCYDPSGIDLTGVMVYE